LQLAYLLPGTCHVDISLGPKGCYFSL